MNALRWLAKVSTYLGVFGILLLAVNARHGTATELISNVSFVSLALGAVTLLVIQHKNPLAQDNGLMCSNKGRSDRRYRSATLFAIAIIVGLLVQTRFQVGTVVAWGDFQPPEGTAWIRHIFSGWAWTGNNLGTLSNSVTVLPWAILVEIVHLLGGTAGLAQRIWFTALLVSVGLVASGLLLTLEFSAVSSVIGGLVYVFNPFMMTASKVLSPGAISGMILPPFFLWWVVMASREKKISFGLWVTLALSATLLGYSYQTPPLAGAAIGFFLSAPLLVEMLYRNRKRTLFAIRATVKGLAVLVTLSAYWIIPAVVQLWYGVIAVGRLNTLSWVSAEGRATIANGFWLNSVPLWHLHIYYSFSRNYSSFPLSLLKWILPIAAFSSLALVAHRGEVLWKQRLIAPLVSLSALLVLLVVLLSTGTRFPGILLFGPLYRLPFGWLLQLPIRFLYLAALGYSILIAVLAEAFGPVAERFLSRKLHPIDKATPAVFRYAANILANMQVAPTI